MLPASEALNEGLVRLGFSQPKLVPTVLLDLLPAVTLETVEIPNESLLSDDESGFRLCGLSLLDFLPMLLSPGTSNELPVLGRAAAASADTACRREPALLQGRLPC